MKILAPGLLAFCLLMFIGSHSGAGMHPAFGRDGAGAVPEEEIAIHAANGEIVAVRGGDAVHREKLGLREEILWKDTRGHVGAVLTDRRLWVVSGSHPGWRYRTLGMEEARAVSGQEVMISDFLVMAVMPGRIVFYDGLAGAWAKTDLPLHDTMEKAVLDNFVGAVITGKRAYGVAARRGCFVEERFLKDERLLSATSLSRSITVRTTRRLLVFRTHSPFWDAVRLD